MRAKVDALRPEALAPQIAEAAQADWAWFQARSAAFVGGHCPLCGPDSAPEPRGGAAPAVYALPSGVLYQRCAHCATLFMSPRPTAEIYAAYYPSSRLMQVFAQRIFMASAQARHELIYKERLARMLNYFSPGSTLGQRGDYVEIGAGSGAFAALVQETGFFGRVIAIEPNADCAADCRQKGLDVLEQSVEQVDLALLQKAQLIACFETLEHLTEPANFIQTLFDKMPAGALLVLTTPNGLGFDIQELGAHSTTLGWTHVHLFNPISLAALLRKSGFSVLDVLTPGILDVDLVARAYEKQKQSQELPPRGWLENLLLGTDEKAKDDFQQFLCAHGMSSHMWAVARKPVVWEHLGSAGQAAHHLGGVAQGQGI